MKRFTQVTCFFAISLVIGTFFQNCGQYQSADPLTTLTAASTSDDCTVNPGDPGCPMDLNTIQLTIGNEDPVTIATTPLGNNGSCDATNCVDVAGYCYVGSYPSNKVYVQITGNVNLAETALTTCNNVGRYRMLVPMPAGMTVGGLYTMIVTVRVFDSQGNRYDNPSGLNRKQVTLTTQ